MALLPAYTRHSPQSSARSVFFQTTLANAGADARNAIEARDNRFRLRGGLSEQLRCKTGRAQSSSGRSHLHAAYQFAMSPQASQCCDATLSVGPMALRRSPRVSNTDCSAGVKF